MKRLFLLVPIMLLIAAVACKKAKGPNSTNSVQQNNNLDSTVSMSATINGFAWQTDSVYGSYVLHSDNDSGAVDLMITATRKKNDTVSTIVFNISNYSGANTYPINPPLNTATYYDAGNIRHYATKGQIVVTNDTGVSIIGVFNFFADTVSVVNGAFNVALP